MSDIESANNFAENIASILSHSLKKRDRAIRAARDNEWRAAWSGSELMGPQGPHEVQAFLSGRDSVTRAVAYEHVAKAFDSMPAVAAAIRQLAKETK